MLLRDILRVKGASVCTISPSATLAEVVAKLVEHNVGSLVVTEDRRMVGIITERDILRACAGRPASLDDLHVQRHMTVDVITVSPEDEVAHTMGVMTQHRVRHLPITNGGELVGIISIGDLVKAQHDQLSLENQYLLNYIQS